MEYVEYAVGERLGCDLNPSNKVLGLDAPTPFTPPVDPIYRFRKDVAIDLFAFWVSGETSMKILGHTGCGKTTGVEQWHARLNLPLLTVVAHPRMEIADLIGHYVPSPDGGMVFHYGPVARAAMEGWSVLIDEYAVLDPGVATGLNGLLQGGMVYIQETGENITPREGFRIFAATNPNDVGAGYNGRNTQDAANNDRFYTIWMDYPRPAEEIPLVQEVLMGAFEEADIALTFAERMVDVANRVRKVYCGVSDDADALDVTFSTRSIRRWASLFCLFFEDPNALHHALRRTLTNGASKEAAAAIHNIVTTVFGTAEAASPA